MQRDLLPILANYPLEVLLRKGLKKPFQLLRKGKEKRRLYASDPRKDEKEHPFPGSLNSFLNTEFFPSSLEEEREKASSHLLHRYLEHRFDLLGSGWMKWDFATEARGFEGYHYEHRMDDPEDPATTLYQEHRSETRRILALIRKANYEGIDWQRDMRSGFRWDASMWWDDQMQLTSGHPGADPKIPMELGRLQHLPRMAVIALTREERDPLIEEFRSQVLDFIAMNPPGMGIQWACPMDVGIRAINLLIAQDLFFQMDRSGLLDEAFQDSLIASIHQHARFILDHLEYQEGLTGNHYLFNVAGLLFCGAYLPSSPFSDRIFALGIKELIRELFKQFFPKGGNFEGSSAYHILGCELLIHSSALLLGSKERLRRMGWDEVIRLSKRSLGMKGTLRSTAENPLPEAFIERLQRVIETSEAFRKPNDEHPQIGDNDSGRLFRLSPVGNFRRSEELGNMYQDRPTIFEEEEGRVFDENLLDFQGVLAAGTALFGEEKNEASPEAAIVRSFLGEDRSLTLKRKEKEPIELPPFPKRVPQGNSKEHFIPFPEEEELAEATWWVDPDAGFLILRTERLHLTLSAPPGKGHRHTWGHMHNDRSGIELYAGGQDLLVDPGSYVYQALPNERNAFRSVEAHNVPIIEGMEQNRWPKGKKGIFFLRRESRCQLISLDQEELQVELMLEYRGVRHYRKVKLERKGLRIEDRCERSFQVNFNRGELHSRGYGKKLIVPS